MLVPLSWLKDYVDINISADELEKKLFDCGFEVEEKWQVGKDISGIVVGYVDSCEPIPETHLHVCQVNVGGPELLQICCGADNVKAGGKFPVAMIGAKVYATAKDHDVQDRGRGPVPDRHQRAHHDRPLHRPDHRREQDAPDPDLL